MKRILGSSNIEVSALGMGCWAIGNTWVAYDGTSPLGWGETNDDESIRALHAALDHGVTLFDTANVYGCGHSETLLGRAFEGRRNEVVIATKFGHDFDEKTRVASGSGSSPEFIRRALEGSLRRLGTDYIDLYQFHDSEFPEERSDEVRETLERLVAEGSIRTYGWSTDRTAAVKAFGSGAHCAATQIQFNVFGGNTEIVSYAETAGLTVLCRSPLAMGLLSDKYTAESLLNGKDIRTTDTSWLTWFKNGKPGREFIERRDAVREILHSGGRSTVQGALAWLWGKSDVLIPIPGFKTTQQALENVKAMEFGPFTAAEVREVEELIGFRP